MHSSLPRIVLGIFLITVGIILVSMNLHILASSSLWRYWPLIIMLAGLGRLVQASERSELRSAIWLLFVGLWLQLCVLHLFDLSFSNSWPLLLIAFGIFTLWEALSRNSREGDPLNT